MVQKISGNQVLCLEYQKGEGACLALRVGGHLISAKIQTKNRPHILRPCLNAVERVSQFFQRVLACIFERENFEQNQHRSSEIKSSNPFGFFRGQRYVLLTLLGRI